MASEKKGTTPVRPAIRSGIDAHNWATKMEIRRILSGKPDLEIELNHQMTSGLQHQSIQLAR
jgi:hypothetical protein